MTRGLTTAVASLALAFAVVMVASASATPVTGAGFTTVNEGIDGTGHCKNGNPLTNCNIYDGKQYVWLNGGPDTAYVGDGDYFFAVLVPGGQHDPNDGAAKNLSDGLNGAYTTRTFSVAGGTVTYTGSHDFDSNKIRLMPYDDTTNPGGVYIMAICSLADGYPVDPSDCKYDAFKIREGETQTAQDLLVEKDATASYTRTFGWTVVKTVDGQESVSYTAGTKVLQYQVVYTKDDGTDSGWNVQGSITVTNPNGFDVTNVNVTDSLDDSTVCTVDDGTYTDANNVVQTVSASGGTMPALAVVTFDYSCSPTDTSSTLNTATVTWDASGTLPAGSQPGTADVTWGDPSKVHDCVTVSDNNPGNITGGSAPSGIICDDTTFNYQVTVTVANGCTDVNNTARFDDGSYNGTDSTTAHICGFVTGGLTIGFWQNKNGQAIITGGTSTAGVCNSGTYLRTFNPFKDLLSTATCSQVAAYVMTIIKNATAKGAAMNAMLKAQMLATALDVFFNKVNGGTYVDLTKICKMIDGSGGTATCSGTYRNVSAAFGGATCITVNAILAYAASQSNSGGSAWYGQVKATQELAKDTFDAINNQVAFSCSP
jgi:hypothetical protein